mmetsp:Transcript_77774/g.137119  ORF Transcript_77774/g.137119 Transcript_77774/m.137119 type:complete len:279 (-) Transcript_77774:866-1702(-)
MALFSAVAASTHPMPGVTMLSSLNVHSPLTARLVSMPSTACRRTPTPAARVRERAMWVTAVGTVDPSAATTCTDTAKNVPTAIEEGGRTSASRAVMVKGWDSHPCITPVSSFAVASSTYPWAGVLMDRSSNVADPSRSIRVVLPPPRTIEGHPGRRASVTRAVQVSTGVPYLSSTRTPAWRGAPTSVSGGCRWKASRPVRRMGADTSPRTKESEACAATRKPDPTPLMARPANSASPLRVGRVRRDRSFWNAPGDPPVCRDSVTVVVRGTGRPWASRT